MAAVPNLQQSTLYSGISTTLQKIIKSENERFNNNWIFVIDLLFKDGSKQTIHQTSAIWAMNKKRVFINVNTRMSIESAQLISGSFMNADESNNFF